jgi:DNA polymerase-1
MIIAEAPGKDEDKYKIPLIGPVGQHLRENLLPDAGIEEGEVYFTNGARCRPPGNKTPTARELQNCRPYLENEIRAVKPKVIIAMGNAPLASLIGMIYKPTIDAEGNKAREGKVSGITRWRGKPLWSHEFNCWIMPTFHPSYSIRSGLESYITELVIDDLSEATALVTRKPKGEHPRALHVKRPETAIKVLNSMMRAGAFAYDIETGGTGTAREKYIIGCSFSCSSKVGYYIEWKTLMANESVRKVYWEAVTGKYKKYMHNGAYEIKIHRFNSGRINESYFDTMIAAHMVDENFGKSLKDLAWVHTRFGGYDVEQDKYRAKHKIKEDYSKIPIEMLAPYGALDAVATYILGTAFEPVMQEEGYFDLFKKIVMPVRKVMCDAEYNGLRVDVPYAEDLQRRCESALEALNQQVYVEAGEEFNINSPAQLGHIIFDKMGYIPLKRGKTGPSVDKESIEYVAGQGCEIAKILDGRNFIKTMLSNHISQAVKFHWDDGRVHTSYNLARPVTGRTSCQQPGIHNVPRDRLIRTMYIASPGHVLIEADLKSAELAYLAAESGEGAFIRAFANGLDLHAETAKIIYQVRTPTEEQRSFAKSTNFALVYGMTAFGLSKRLEITIEEAEVFIKEYFEDFPLIAEYMEYLRDFVNENGYVKSLFGRRRRLPMVYSDIEWEIGHALRQAQNSPIQSGAADYTYLGLVRLARLLNKARLRAKIVHTVHDCALVDTPRPEVAKVKELIVEAFEAPIKILPVQMMVELEESRAWGEHTETSKVYEILKQADLIDGLKAA